MRGRGVGACGGSGRSGALGLGGQRGGLRADQPRQLDAQFSQGAGGLDLATGPADQALQQRPERHRGMTEITAEVVRSLNKYQGACSLSAPEPQPDQARDDPTQGR